MVDNINRDKVRNDFMVSIKSLIENQIKTDLSDLKTVKCISGIALSEEDDAGYVKVRLVGDNNELSFINKTGERISINDTVFVEYYTSLTRGYIARRAGKCQQEDFIIPVETEEEAKTNFKMGKLYVVLVNDEV